MEVHHHPVAPDNHRDGSHSSRIKWTHYLWEFLMLFLAVFAGFLAENQREHFVEDQRAKTLAKNLYKELLTDSIAVQQCIDNRRRKENDCKYFVDYVKDSNLSNLSARFFPSLASALIQIQYIIFEPNDGVLTQLRNSGELRYFRNSELQSEIGRLSVKIAYVRSRNDKEYSYVEFYQRPFVLRHFDFNWYEKFTRNGALPLVVALRQNLDSLDHGKIVNADKFSRQEAENLASYSLLMLRSTRQIQYKEYADANHQVLQLLRNEFHLE